MERKNNPSPKTGAENVEWQLDDLYADLESLEKSLERVDRWANKFACDHRGRLASMDGSELVQALETFESLHELLNRAYTYAFLYWSTNSESAKRGALLQKVREVYSRITQKVLFFELEWIQMEQESATRLLTSPETKSYRHYLEVQRLFKGHMLSEPEEKILAEKAVTGRSAWSRFFDEVLGAIRFQLGNQVLTEQEVLSKLHDGNREVRRKAALSLTEGLRPHIRELTYIFNTVLAEHAAEDRLRNYPTWLSSRNLSNEISDQTVESLIQVVAGRFELVARYYRLKRRALGLDQMWDYDRYAPVARTNIRYKWDQACRLVLEAYQHFHPTLGSLCQKFLSGRWIDAAVRPGKRGGAFSHSAVPSVHPYILLNYTGSIRDVQTLAHELGHGIHQYLSRKQGLLHSETPLTTAETASVFGEMLVFHRLLEKEKRPEARFSLLMGKIDDSMATVFRQVTMNRFEDRIHTTRRTHGELSVERFGELWLETQETMFQNSVQLGNHYRIWWSYIPHFIHTPGYVYAYAFGELLALALFSRYQQDRSEFAPRYLQLLEAGGSDWPQSLVAKLGVDLDEKTFWQQGLTQIEGMIEEAEELALEVDLNLQI